MMRNRDVEVTCKLTPRNQALLDQVMARFRLSGRTIADLEGSDAITIPHFSEAISYRTLDRLLVT